MFLITVAQLTPSVVHRIKESCFEHLFVSITIKDNLF